jgi:hypothetical protein
MSLVQSRSEEKALCYLILSQYYYDFVNSRAPAFRKKALQGLAPPPVCSGAPGPYLPPAAWPRHTEIVTFQ